MIDSCYWKIPPVHLLKPCPDALLFEAAPDARCCQAPTPTCPSDTIAFRAALLYVVGVLLWLELLEVSRQAKMRSKKTAGGFIDPLEIPAPGVVVVV